MEAFERAFSTRAFDIYMDAIGQVGPYIPAFEITNILMNTCKLLLHIPPTYLKQGQNGDFSKLYDSFVGGCV